MGARVLGRSLWDCISDSTLHSLYQSLVGRVKCGEPVKFNYRCDGPDRRRWLAMLITRLEDGGLEFASSLVREEWRVLVPLLESGGSRTEHFVRVCSWCQLVATDSGQWLPVESAVQVLGLMDQDELPQITHTICPSCKALLMEQIGRRR